MQKPLRLEDFAVSSRTGFLPESDPEHRNGKNPQWHHTARTLPKLMTTGKIRNLIEQLPNFEVESGDLLSLENDMRILSYLGHAYLWGQEWVVKKLPRNLSDAWVLTSERLDRPPILSYPSYCLFNWRRLDASKAPFLGNIQIVENFMGGADEDWFILIHVDIEARAARAIKAIPQLIADAQNGEINGLVNGLEEVHEALKDMNTTMERMPELCDPYIYYTRVRPYIFGTKNNPSIPDGLIYEGHYHNQPQFFRGETGAQSAIVPALDGLLGIYHENDPLKEYLIEMRNYMLPAHRKFIETVENESKVREMVVANREHEALLTAYDNCFEELFRFRAKHFEYAAAYIHKQAAKGNNSTEVGTGGTPFMQYLAKHRDETRIERQMYLHK
jgi:indoleamine 2,3-dioxygenase